SAIATAGPFTTLPAALLLRDDVEGAPQFSGPAPWAVTTEQSASASHSYTDSPGAPYAVNQDIALTQNSPVTLTGSAPVLTFEARTDLQPDSDFLYVQISVNGGAWQDLAALGGASGWRTHTLPLAAYRGASVRI